MRKINEILRLHFEQKLSLRKIAQSSSTGRTAVAEYQHRFEEAGLGWHEASRLDDTELERKLSPPRTIVLDKSPLIPDWSVVYRELRRPGVTLSLLLV